MQRKALEVNPNPVPGEYSNPRNHLQLKDVASVERSKKNKIYPKGAIIIQVSATSGEVGLLTSSGKVGSQYAVVEPMPWVDSRFLFYCIKRNIKRHFHKYQTGLNATLDTVENIPIAIP